MIILVISTSSPTASVALFRDGKAIGHGFEVAPRAASGAAIRVLRRLLSENGVEVKDVDLFVADVGPGSFTGVKVGVMLAKTLAFALGKKAAGISAFDLISSGAAAIPARKGQFFLRTAGVEVVPDTDARLKSASMAVPDAVRAEALLPTLRLVEPEELLPDYVLEPSISQPKVPYKTQVPE